MANTGNIIRGKDTTMEFVCLPKVQTVNLTTQTVYSIPVAELKSVFVRVEFVAAKSDFSGNYGGYVQGSFYRASGGNVAKGGNLITDLGGSIPGLVVDMVANTGTQNIDIKFTGTLGVTINWFASLYLVYNT